MESAADVEKLRKEYTLSGLYRTDLSERKRGPATYHKLARADATFQNSIQRSTNKRR